jgi:glucose-1-phosphate adenylyltransferase
MRGEFGEFVEVIPAQQKTGNHWYRGTADAVYQNIDVMHSQIQSDIPEPVVITVNELMYLELYLHVSLGMLLLMAVR